MTIPAPDAPAYTDLKALSALKRGAASKDPAAIREVARQFESMFTRMVLKSMRDAVGKDPVFGSDQEQTYQGMADDQMAIQLSRGKGLGLADMLVRQLQKMGATGDSSTPGSTTPTAGTVLSGLGSSSAPNGAAAYLATQRATQGATQSAVTAASPEVQKNFITNFWNDAQQAAQQLGVNPGSVLAQAALETNWGRNMPQDGAGNSSNNLFGIKAAGDWSGAAVVSATQEYSAGTPSDTAAHFRAYADPSASFRDYVALLRDNPRYSGALNTGSDAHAFAAGLQRGGYATDPDYVHKIGAVARNITDTVTRGGIVTDLKSASAAPLTASTSAL